MPYVPTTPEDAPVAAAATKTLDKFHIHDLSFRLDPNDANKTHAVVQWSEGYMNGTNYVAARRHTSKLEGAAFLAKIAEAAPSGTFYDVVKQGIWDYMEAQGILPTGAVS